MKKGEIYKTNNCGKLKVVKYIDSKNIKIKFLATGYKTWTSSGHINKGSVKDPYHPSVQGIGYGGVGKYTRTNDPTVYEIWKSALRRVYNPASSSDKRNYKGCTVHPDWHNFQTFAEWYEAQPNAYREGFDLDKDLLVLGNKQYGPNTCSLVPQEINELLTKRDYSRGKWPIGVYYNKRNNKFVAQCNVRGEAFHLGYFDTPEEAHEVYLKFKRKVVRDTAKKHKADLDSRIYTNLLHITVEQLL